MIKLIATDIDGTLVNSKKELPPDFDLIIKRLNKMGVCFALASGRSFEGLKDSFGEYINDISLICDNGALVIDRGEVLGSTVMSRESVLKIIDVCEKNDMYPLLCTAERAYVADGTAAYRREVELYYSAREALPDIRKYDGEITKIAIYKDGGIEKDGLAILEREFGDSCCVVLSGFYWVDIMAKGVSKGRGVERLQERLGAAYEETMAFGDYLNDSDMLSRAYYSFAMANAHPLVRETANFVTGSNEEFAVAKEIKRLVFGESDICPERKE